jgi:hypothetical protein
MRSSAFVLCASVATVAFASVSAVSECDTSALFDVANAHYPSCEGLYYVLAQSMPVKYTSRLCSDTDCQEAFTELRALQSDGDCTVFGNTTLVEDILDQCLTTSSASATVTEDESNLCDIADLFSIANAHYPSCEGLYYVLAQSMPVNSTSSLCGIADCARALDQLRDLNLGDCIVFDSTTLTSDILDQCPSSSSSESASEVSDARTLGAAAGTAIVLGVLGLVALVILVTTAVRRTALAKRSLKHMEAADSKLARSDSDTPYSAAIDLQASSADFSLRGVGQGS